MAKLVIRFHQLPLIGQNLLKFIRSRVELACDSAEFASRDQDLSCSSLIQTSITTSKPTPTQMARLTGSRRRKSSKCVGFGQKIDSYWHRS